MTKARSPSTHDVLPSPAEIDCANRLRSILASQIRPGKPTRLEVATDQQRAATVVLAPALAHTFLELLRYVGSGQAVAIVPTGHALTTQQAADILNISRPHLIKLLGQGEIGYVLVGRHRRIVARDLLEYKKRRDADRAAALAQLAEVDSELL